ncbi:MAG: DUF3300 domain-containing protein [Xanthobacteraceae bacterium]|nr:DUF3300 domain-containing protein [Xanthobacteraceae bacterium]
MAQTSTPAAPATAQLLSPAQLDQLVAPIALYPDPLLAEVLMASTYPVDVVHAERWLEENKNLSPDQLKAGADKQPWDQSIKALVATPDVLAMMSSKLEWTQKLGNAVIAQQADVMNAVQDLRGKAQANNKLASSKEQTVKVEQVQTRQIIAIEPTQPDTVYVPYYDPGVVYGGWAYPDYPPYYFAPPAYIGAGLIAGGLAFGAGYALGRWAGGGAHWGGSVNWNNNNININRPINGGGTNWQRGSGNRQGLGGGGRQQGVNFHGNRGAGSLGNRGGAGNRANLGNRGGNRGGASAGNRGGGHVAHRGHAGNSANLGNRGGNRGGAGAGNRGGGGHVAHRGGGSAAHGVARAAGRGGGGVHRGGGGSHRGGGGRGGGGRRSDITLKHDIVLLGYLENGLGFYRFTYNGDAKAYVGVMAQDVQQIAPDAVVRGPDGYLLVYYEKLGLKFQSYDQWIASGAHVPHARRLAY